MSLHDSQELLDRNTLVPCPHGTRRHPKHISRHAPVPTDSAYSPQRPGSEQPAASFFPAALSVCRARMIHDVVVMCRRGSRVARCWPRGSPRAPRACMACKALPRARPRGAMRISPSKTHRPGSMLTFQPALYPAHVQRRPRAPCPSTAARSPNGLAATPRRALGQVRGRAACARLPVQVRQGDG